CAIALTMVGLFFALYFLSPKSPQAEQAPAKRKTPLHFCKPPMRSLYKRPSAELMAFGVLRTPSGANCRHRIAGHHSTLCLRHPTRLRNTECLVACIPREYARVLLHVGPQ